MPKLKPRQVDSPRSIFETGSKKLVDPRAMCPRITGTGRRRPLYTLNEPNAGSPAKRELYLDLYPDKTRFLFP